MLPAGVADNPERLARFEREARAMAALAHPNVIDIHDIGVHDGAPYLVEELLEGESLRLRLADGRVTPAEAVDIAVQIARGLAAAHERRIVHRDLKPENVFLTASGLVKILDFGLAAPIAAPVEPSADTLSGEPTGATEPGRVLGTVAYMAPEQARGLPLDHRADIFAFGVVLYEMLAGERPFKGETVTDVLASLLKDNPPPLPVSVPSLLRSVVARCLEKRPADRFASAHDLALVLRPAQSRDQLRAAAARRSPAGSGAARAAWALAASAALAVLAAMSAWLTTVLRSDGPPRFRLRQVTSRPGIGDAPAISPSGTEIAYSATEDGNTDIWAVDVRGGQPLRLTSLPGAATDPAWFPDGSAVVFVADGVGRSSIAKVPRFGGNPVVLLEDGFDPAVSPEGTRIAFTRQAQNGFMRVFHASLDDPRGARVLSGSEGGLWDHRNPAWSPDGREIAYQDQNDIWVARVDGGPPRNVSGDHAADFDPAWSADGSHIYFASLREGIGAIWRVPRAGGQPERVTMGNGPERAPSVSANGLRLACATHRESTSVVLVDTASGRRTLVEDGRLLYGHAIAPDRSSLALVSNRDGEFDVWLLRLRDNRPDGGPVRLTDQQGTCASPAFSPDGAWLAYHRVAGGQRDVWVIPVAGGMPVNFTASPASDAFPDWSPDGRRIAFVSDRGGSNQVWVAAVTDGRRGSEPVQVSHGAGSAFVPAWSPDGRHIAYVDRSPTGSEAWVVAADGSDVATQVTRDAGAAFVGWDFTSGTLLAVGTWGGEKLSLRSLRGAGGETQTLPLAVPTSATAWVADFDCSRDGKLLSLLEQEVRRDIWVLESRDRSF